MSDQRLNAEYVVGFTGTRVGMTEAQRDTVAALLDIVLPDGGTLGSTLIDGQADG